MSTGAPSLAQLVARARDPALPLDSQHTAFEQLVERSRHVVLARSLVMMRDRAEAEDVAQETYLTAWLRLAQLRDGAAFTAWVRRIAENHCRRRLRSRGAAPPITPPAMSERSGYEDGKLVAHAVASLPPAERHVAVLFYYLGLTQEEIAQRLGLRSGTVGKRLHSARLRIRRRLPRSLRERFVRHLPSPRFRDEIRRGLHDQYVGEYRFATRPQHVVRIYREGDLLVAEGGGQRTVLASLGADELVTGPYDGYGRFVRDADGQVTQFVYYEFGRRLGIARKVAPR